MASKTGNGHWKGPVDNRSQTHNPKIGRHVKRDTTSGQFTNVKTDKQPFKSVAKEPDGRRK